MNNWNSDLDQRHLACLSFHSVEDLLYTRFMPSFYILIVIFSLPLNTLALVTFICKIREKKPAVIYMSHLACVNLLFTLMLPLKIHYHFNSLNWVFGEAACRVVTAAHYCYMYCSILLMMCMSVDRLLGVLFPIVYLPWRSARKATLVCILVWLLALAISMPLLFKELTSNYGNGVFKCLDSQYYEKQFVSFMLMFSSFFSISFFLPLVITLVSYFTIIYVILVKSNNTASSSSSSDKRRRAIIMAIVVLTEFVVCFGPNNGILICFCVCLFDRQDNFLYYLYFNYSKIRANSLYSNYLLALSLGSASVFLSPLLYYYGSSQCRKMIQSLLRR